MTLKAALIRVSAYVSLVCQTAAAAVPGWPSPDDPVKWTWHCAYANNGVKELIVFTDGSYRAQSEQLDSPFIVKVRQKSSSGNCSINNAYVEITGYTQSDLKYGDPCSQVVSWDGDVISKNIELKDLVASINTRAGLFSLKIVRDGQLWRFALSDTSITTEQEANRVWTQIGGKKLPAHTFVSVFSGECSLDPAEPK